MIQLWPTWAQARETGLFLSTGDLNKDGMTYIAVAGIGMVSGCIFSRVNFKQR